MWTKTFWAQVLERVVKAFSASLLASLTAGATGILSVPWTAALGVAALAAVVSVLQSIVSAGVGPTGTPSLVETTDQK